MIYTKSLFLSFAALLYGAKTATAEYSWSDYGKLCSEMGTGLVAVDVDSFTIGQCIDLSPNKVGGSINDNGPYGAGTSRPYGCSKNEPSFSGRVSIYRQSQKGNIATTGIAGFSQLCTSPAEDLGDASGVHGDPHVETLHPEAPPYSIHMQCEMKMMESESFLNGSGFRVFIRTTRVDNHNGMSYSYISGVAVNIGRDVLEVKDDGSLIINGATDTEFQNEAQDIIVATRTRSFAGFLLTTAIKGKKKSIFVYDLSLIDGTSIHIRANIKTGMINVDTSGSFPDDLVGLLGSQHHPQLFARDGKTDLSGHWNALGEEWQIRSDEPKLFQDKDYQPQYPAGCLYKEAKKTHIRRRLRDVQSVTAEAAAEACARATGVHKQFCIEDVLATGDVDLADEDRFYGGSMI